jgi:hypothetical protein
MDMSDKEGTAAGGPGGHVKEQEMEVVDAQTFFEKIPPDRPVQIVTTKARSNLDTIHSLPLPDINLHCNNCDGFRYFKSSTGEISFVAYPARQDFITYTCKNCQKQTKVYSVQFVLKKSEGCCVAVKFGERPAFGPPTPGKLLKILGSEKEYFLRGRRCEIQGLGVGAFTYYRRIIENKKDALFDQVIRVANTLNADAEQIADLEAAKNEIQFKKAVESIKHGIPSVLLINGHNPLTLLHDALSEGVHVSTDDECLSLATDIRFVLIEFVEKVSEAIKDDAQLNAAVTNLLNRKARREAAKTEGSA